MDSLAGDVRTLVIQSLPRVSAVALETQHLVCELGGGLFQTQTMERLLAPTMAP